MPACKDWTYYGLRPADTALLRRCAEIRSKKVHYAETKFTGLQRDGCQRTKLARIVLGSRGEECKSLKMHVLTGSNGSFKEGDNGSGAKRRPTVVAPDALETPMSVASAAAEPYVPTPASTVRSTGKENETSWANGRPNHWLSDHRNPMYGQVSRLRLSCIIWLLVLKES